MTMHVTRHDDAAAFADKAMPLLAADEARHNLILGLLATLVDTPEVYPEFQLWLASDSGHPEAAALRTPPHQLVLAAPASDDALVLLARAVAKDAPDIPGVVGGMPEAEGFARAFAEPTGRPWRTAVEQGIYALTHVREQPEPSGSARRAGPDDAEVILGWLRPFNEEAVPDDAWDEEGSRRRLARRLSRDSGLEGLYLWDDPDPVSMVGVAGTTPTGVRVGPVYTPPESRRRGYATALTAHVSRRMLAGGRRFCFLYTDMSNPTSNAIYQRIGYELTCRSVMISFADA